MAPPRIWRCISSPRSSITGPAASSAAGPNGETSASYAGIGDLTLMGKYNLLPEGDVMPAVTAVGGLASIPTGHASHLNPAKLGMDAVGTGALTFTSGVNLYKWVKPFLIYSNIWMNNPINIYKLGPDPTRTVRSRDYVTFNLAGEYPIPNSKFVLLLEMYSNWTWSNLTQPGTNSHWPRVTRPRRPLLASCRRSSSWPRRNCPCRRVPPSTWRAKTGLRNTPPCFTCPMPFRYWL